MRTIACRVAEELHAYADLPFTDGEVEEALDAVHDRVDGRTGRRTRSQGLLIAVAALGAIAVAAGAGLVLRSETSVPGGGPLPPNGRLVMEYWSHPLWGHDGKVWVYGDGRVITSEREESPAAPYEERRLTASGLDVLLDRVARRYDGTTVDELRHPCDPYQPCRASVASVIEVEGVRYNVSDNEAVAGLLFDMESQLPHHVWWQREPTPYVPPAYEACYGTGNSLEPAARTERSSLLDGLPEEARDLLAAKPTTQVPDADVVCSRLAPSEAASVADAVHLTLGLNDEWAELDAGDVHGSLFVQVVLPHGAPGGYGG